MRQRFKTAGLCACVLVLAGRSLGAAQERIDWHTAGEEAVEWLRQYLMIDTTNPPGNESRAAEFFARILRKEGIPYQLMESSPGRGIIYARLPGDGTDKGLVLLNHMDVVPATRETWSVDPFGGVVKEGFLYGRGANDMKNLGMLQFAVFVQIHRNKVPLKRDLIFLGTGDEEAGGYVGAGWVASHHQELLKTAGYLVNEGGGGRVRADGHVTFNIRPAEKVPCWVRLTAYGAPGHGSVPNPNSAVHRLLRALQRVLDYDPPIIVTPPVDRYFKTLATLEKGPRKAQYENIRESVKDPDFVKNLRETNRGLYALLTNTTSINRIQDYSGKVNVIPPKAEAEIDFRLVPGYDGDQWVREIEKVIADPGIQVLKMVNWEANESPIDTPLADTIRDVLRESYPNVTFLYNVATGFNDNHWFRPLGIVSYGFSTLAPGNDEEGGGAHGNDERVSIDAWKRALPLFYEVVRRFCTLATRPTNSGR